MKDYYVFLLVLLICPLKSNGQQVTTQPSFHLDFFDSSFRNTPTGDKPQSKLWYMDDQWWAILPDSSGPTLWQRGKSGWRERKEINDHLKGLPGRVDVWYEKRQVTALSVSESSLYILRIEPQGSANQPWTSSVLAKLSLPMVKSLPNIETGTITKDSKGIWWVAADVGGKEIYIWASSNARDWSNPILIGENINPDDISIVTSLKKSIIVIWSNQNGDYSVNARQHLDGLPITDWSNIDTIAVGNKTADDHLNTALSADGTLWLVSKNSIDVMDRPQLVLRVRTPKTLWKNYPYLPRKEASEPSRPVVFATCIPGLLLSGYTLYDDNTIYNNKNDYNGKIVFGVIDTTDADILKERATIIAPHPSFRAHINDITGPKGPFPKNGPWIILASDKNGYVYEADLKQFFRRKSTK